MNGAPYYGENLRFEPLTTRLYKSMIRSSVVCLAKRSQNNELYQGKRREAKSALHWSDRHARQADRPANGRLQ
jgi:hypothetical protein